jgi:hypothetical protein
MSAAISDNTALPHALPVSLRDLLSLSPPAESCLMLGSGIKNLFLLLQPETQ